MIIIKDYWPPFLRPNSKAQGMAFIYEKVDTLEQWSSVFQHDPNTDSMTLVQLDKDGKFMCRWYFRYDSKFGLAEWADDIPQSGFWAWICGENKKIVMDPPIGWGNFENPYKNYQNDPRFSTFKCCPPQIGIGKQVIIWEKVHDEFTLHNGKKYNNVLQFLYQQSWNGAEAAGARMWMAHDALDGFAGPIANQWVAVKKDGTVVEEPRQDAIAISIW